MKCKSKDKARQEVEAKVAEEQQVAEERAAAKARRISEAIAAEGCWLAEERVAVVVAVHCKAISEVEATCEAEVEAEGRAEGERVACDPCMTWGFWCKVSDLQCCQSCTDTALGDSLWEVPGV